MSARMCARLPAVLARSRPVLAAQPALSPPCGTPLRALCVNLRKADGNQQDAWFAKQEREALEKLKATLAKKKKPMDEKDEKVRLQKIIEAVGVREAIRDELTTKLLLWKHDEDLTLE